MSEPQLVGEWTLLLEGGIGRSHDVHEHNWTDKQGNLCEENPIMEHDETCVRFEWANGNETYYPWQHIIQASYRNTH